MHFFVLQASDEGPYVRVIPVIGMNECIYTCALTERSAACSARLSIHNNRNTEHNEVEQYSVDDDHG